MGGGGEWEYEFLEGQSGYGVDGGIYAWVGCTMARYCSAS